MNTEPSPSLIRSLLLRTFRHQTLYWVRQDLRALRHRVVQKVQGRNPGSIKPTSRYLNIACGPHGLRSDEWFNLDGAPAPGLDFVTDVSARLPFPDGRFAGIYTEHFLEHLVPGEAHGFLRECLRVLRPGGVLRVSVPDCELYLRNYFGDRAWMLEQRGRVYSTPMEVVNEVFRQRYEHQYGYDFETLALWLRGAGFEAVERVDFGRGALPALQIDQPARRFESLYVEARKPA